MALSTEVQSWLEGLQKEGSLSAEAIALLRSQAESNPATAEFLKGSVLRQSDYSRRLTELDTAKKDADAALAKAAETEAAVTAFQTDLGRWKADAEPEYRRALAAQAEAEGKAAAAQARLRSLGKAYNVPESELGLEAPVVDPARPIVPAIGSTMDTSQFITKDSLQKTIAESAMIDASIHDLDMEYFELTGKHLKNAAEIVSAAIQSGKPLRSFAEEKLGLPKLRTDAAQAAIQKQIDEGIAAGVAAKLSDPNFLPNSGSRGDEARSPIFGRQNALPSPSQLDAGEKDKGVPAAMAAYTQGKYKQGR